MIVRIVKMTFEKDKVDDFLSIFAASKALIRASEGCKHLELWQEKKDGNIFFTYSHWDDESYLDKYRHSALFADVWAKTKALFADKPEAWTVLKKEEA